MLREFSPRVLPEFSQVAARLRGVAATRELAAEPQPLAAPVSGWAWQVGPDVLI